MTAAPTELAPPQAIRLLARIADCEGPTIARDGTVHVVSISEGRSYALREGAEPEPTVLHGGPNGLTEGPDGILYAAQMGSRLIAPPDPPTTGGVQSFTPGGEVRWVTTDPISPNDLCFGPDGMLYVTDPTRPYPTVDDGRLWRWDPATGDAQLLRSVGWYPNGIGFGPSDDHLYVAAMSRSAIVRFPVDGRGLGEPELVVRLPYGVPDGFAFDVEGRLVVGAIQFDDAPGELQVFEPDGTLSHRLRLGPHSRYTNLAIGADGTAYVTCTDGGEVLELRGVCDPGLPLHPFR